MEPAAYLGILTRRWFLIALIIALDVLGSAYLYHRSSASAGYQSCSTLYVADMSSPSLISAPPTDLQSAGALLAGETAANFFADDILDIAQSSDVASYITGKVYPTASLAQAPNWGVGGSRKDRTVTLCLTNASSSIALKAGAALAAAMTKDRSKFLGPMARRVYTRVISPASVGPAPTSNAKLSFLLRLALGVLVALGAAFLWDALDPRVRNPVDVERALRVPVLSD
jgi:capsular polysaccharide biosynthesis protein